MNKEYYVLLINSRKNSGDHLIRVRATELLKKHRQDRTLVEMNNWEPISDENLITINNAKAAILLGGPGLRQDSYPSVYPLRKNLDDITVPIIMLGTGYRDMNTLADSSTSYIFSESTLKLLTKIEKSGYKSSVRDFLSLNTLLHKGFSNFSFSGCPALYELNNIDVQNNNKINSIKKVAFATGRGYLKYEGFFDQQIELILKLNKYFSNIDFSVAFHDPITDDPKTKLLIKILKEKKINYIDISSTADKLTSFYNNIDLQIGYRVHAHIYMASIGKPTVLICEDSRGLGIRTVLNGLIFNAYNFQPLSFIDRVRIKFSNKSVQKNFIPAKNLYNDIVVNIESEIRNDWPRIKATNSIIQCYYNEFIKILKQLP